MKFIDKAGDDVVDPSHLQSRPSWSCDKCGDVTYAESDKGTPCFAVNRHGETPCKGRYTLSNQLSKG